MTFYQLGNGTAHTIAIELGHLPHLAARSSSGTA